MFTYLLLLLLCASSAHQALDMVLKEAVSIEGRLLMLDDKTPHVAVSIQAVRDEEIVTTTLSGGDGRYQFFNLRPGVYQVRCYTPDGYMYYTEERTGKPEYGKTGKAGREVTPDKPIDLWIERGQTLKNIDFCFAPFKKGYWKTYTYLDGLADNSVLAIHRDQDNVLWFGTDVGISRYDGKEFINYTKKDGLAENHGRSIQSDPSGALWIGTSKGISRYNGRGFTNFTVEDGLSNNSITTIYSDSNGVLWFGTANGVSRYDGKNFTNLTMGDGLPNNYISAIHCDRNGVMWFGTNYGASRYDGKEFINFTTQDGLAHNSIKAIYCDLDGIMWIGTNGGISRYDGREFVNYTTEDGLIHNEIKSIYRDPHGLMWFSTQGGVSVYDGTGFINFTTQDGLAHNNVNAIHAYPDGVLWFATEFCGVSKYSEATFINLTTRDGLVNNFVNAMHLEPDGVIWFGTDGGVTRCDGKEFINFTIQDGLAHNEVNAVYGGPDGTMCFGTSGGGVSWYDNKSFSNFAQVDALLSPYSIKAICPDKDGVMWFGGLGVGICSYDGEELTHFTAEDGLAGNEVRDIHCDPEGILWIATDGGISQYDGKEFANITIEQGLVDNLVRAIYRDPDGIFWFGTNDGISRYDGEKFTNFTTVDGLIHNRVECVCRTADGILCFTTGGGGVSLFDGDAWTSLDTRDGLAGNNVYDVKESADGSLIFATDGGVTWYRRSTNPPEVRINSVQVGKKRYTDLAEVPSATVESEMIIECSVLDFKTVPEKRQYRYRISELDSAWRRSTKSPQFEWTPEKSGTYTFEVQAIDRDLNYSEPVSLTIAISGLPFYRTDIFLLVLSIVGGVSLSATIILGIQRWRLSHVEKLRLLHELEDAHQMQVNLLPDVVPMMEGFDIAGFSKPSREVGGDFFDYIPMADERTGIALADVSGKGLKGAMNAVMVNGMLHEVWRDRSSCAEILSVLNAALYPRMEKHMFIALGAAILNQDTGTMQWSSAGQPCPMVKRGSEVFEFQGDGGIPLAMIPDSAYEDRDMEFQEGDIVIAYTDGIIEAENKAKEMYGTERLEKLIKHMDPTMDAEEIIKVILEDVSDFIGTAEQYDDMTIVVLKKF